MTSPRLTALAMAVSIFLEGCASAPKPTEVVRELERQQQPPEVVDLMKRLAPLCAALTPPECLAEGGEGQETGRVVILDIHWLHPPNGGRYGKPTGIYVKDLAPCCRPLISQRGV